MNRVGTDEQPFHVVEEKSNSIISIVRPLGTVTLIKMMQRLPLDGTYSDSTTGYLKTDNLQVDFYTPEVEAAW